MATHPKAAIACCIVVLAILCGGLYNINIQSNPQKIWVPPGSTTSRQQKMFDDAFNPFYRINQIIFTLKPEAQEFFHTDNILQAPFLQAVLPLQTAIVDGVHRDAHGTTFSLPDYCFEPIRGKGCMYQTPLDFWRSLPAVVDGLDYTKVQGGILCDSYGDPVTKKALIGCLSSIGVPVLANATMGGLQCIPAPGEDGQSNTRHLCKGGCDKSAKALMITFLLNDMPSVQAGARVWEKEVFLRRVEEFQKSNARFDPANPNVTALDVSYMAQRSIPDELVVVEQQNKFVVLFSYVAMFAYIVFALGQFPHPVKSRVLLGFNGIVIVGLSVGTSIGIVSYAGMAITMIVTEVVPFLVLAIGVDNMFIISKAWDRRVERCPDEDVTATCSATLAEVGPTITAAAISECLAFAVGASTNIPALQGFCIVAAVAVFVDFLLQITWFVAAVSLDARRVRARRADVAPCVTVSRDVATPETSSFWACVHRGKFVKSFMRRVWAPVLMNPFVKAVVLLAWCGVLAASVLAAGHFKLGLEQDLALPDGSYLTTYFDQQSTLGDAGPPAYIVLQNVNYSHPDALDAIDTVVRGVTAQSDVIEAPVYNWFQAFHSWDAPNTAQAVAHCIDQNTCDCKMPLAHNYSLPQRVRRFLYDIPLNSSCCQSNGYCGGQYAMDVAFLWEVTPDGEHVPKEIMHTRLRTQHTPVSNQVDFIRAMQTTQHVVKKLAHVLPQVDVAKLDLPRRHVPLPPRLPSDESDHMHFNWVAPAPGGAAFAYSLFYVYYEQYDYIRGVALQNLLLALGAVFCAALIISSPAVSVFVVVCVASVAIQLVGFLYCLNPPESNDPSETHKFSVDINAVSVVNLVMAVGLAVEFCVHIATSFMETPGSRNARATHAVVEMGSSVVTGITFTKLVGIIVLAWAPSKLFRLYYFRMYLGIVVCGVFNGLMFLPVALSLVGPGPTTASRAKSLSDAASASASAPGALYAPPPGASGKSSEADRLLAAHGDGGHYLSTPPAGDPQVVMGRAVSSEDPQ